MSKKPAAVARWDEEALLLGYADQRYTQALAAELTRWHRLRPVPA